MAKTKTFLKGAVLGGLVAVAIGALNSPKKRKELRKRVDIAVKGLSEKGGNLQKEAKPFFDSVSKAAKSTLEEAKRGFGKAKVEGKKAVKEISREVKPAKKTKKSTKKSAK